MFCDAERSVTFMFWQLYVLELLHCVQLRFVALRHVTFTLCCFTLCSNIFPPSVSAPSSCHIGDLNSCLPDLELEFLAIRMLGWVSAGFSTMPALLLHMSLVFHRWLSIRENDFIAGRAYGKMFKIEYLCRIEYGFQNLMSWDHKDSVSAKKYQKNFMLVYL